MTNSKLTNIIQLAISSQHTERIDLWFELIDEEAVHAVARKQLTVLLVPVALNALSSTIAHIARSRRYKNPRQTYHGLHLTSTKIKSISGSCHIL